MVEENQKSIDENLQTLGGTGGGKPKDCSMKKPLKQVIKTKGKIDKLINGKTS